MTINCIQCGKKFAPPCHRTKCCSAKCSTARRKARHQSPEYRARNKAGRALRRKKNPQQEYQSLKQRRPWKAIANAKRSNAKRKGIKYSLTDAWFERNYLKGCAITGIDFQMGVGVICPYSATVDRINPKKGYTPKNCRLVLHGVNALKGNGTDDDMRKIAKAITRRQ